MPGRKKKFFNCTLFHFISCMSTVDCGELLRYFPKLQKQEGWVTYDMIHLLSAIQLTPCTHLHTNNTLNNRVNKNNTINNENNTINKNNTVNQNNTIKNRTTKLTTITTQLRTEEHN